MAELVLLTEGGDRATRAVVQGARRVGVRPVVVDLDAATLTLDGSAEEVVVRTSYGAALRPDVVVNRTSVSLGLASAAALARQVPTTWQARHLAAREEQGLALACLDAWHGAGAAVLNTVRAVDLSLQRPLVEHRLRAAGVDVGRQARVGDRAARLVVLDGTVIAAALASSVARAGAAAESGPAWQRSSVSPATAAWAKLVTDGTETRLAVLSIWWQPDRPIVLRAWSARPSGPPQMWGEVLRALGHGHEPGPVPFLVEDLSDNLIPRPR